MTRYFLLLDEINKLKHRLAEIERRLDNSSTLGSNVTYPPKHPNEYAR